MNYHPPTPMILYVVVPPYQEATFPLLQGPITQLPTPRRLAIAASATRPLKRGRQLNTPGLADIPVLQYLVSLILFLHPAPKIPTRTPICIKHRQPHRFPRNSHI